ncbi:MAG: dethiobiotin synthase [Nitrospira sp.]|nr:dethiobiotin synthase [bacterium]MBL7049898.1 dethiobiotin synthase [Nitrospira sp.]
MNKGLFITGTDTGIGKTFITGGLLRVLKAGAVNACPMKPAESGCKIFQGQLIPADAVKLLKAAGLKESLDLVNPYRLRNPLAPAVAAGIEGLSIKKAKILSAYKILSNKYDTVLVEGAGGLMVPLNSRYCFADLAADMGLPLLIVARPGLGTINHTLLTIEAARARGIEIAGVVFNHAEGGRQGLSVKSNPDVISKLGRVRIFGTVPHCKDHKASLTEKIFAEILCAAGQKLI